MNGEDIDKLHTTPMGAARIRRNLGLDADPVLYCKGQIGRAVIERGGNWYAVTEREIITINAGSRTIITAHKRGRK